jgi:WD40 repeat protein
MLITVHSKDVTFRHAVTGDVISSKGNMGGPSGELTTATIDSRRKKLVLGDSRGFVTVYNCLSGALLGSLHVSSTALVQMSYSEDKNIICLNSQGDIIVIDDCPRDADSTLILRVMERTHDADVVCMTYSHALGLIATADCIGTLMIWDYEFFSLLMTVYHINQNL